jgi:hypothetical protein
MSRQESGYKFSRPETANRNTADLRFDRDGAWLIYRNKMHCNSFFNIKEYPHYEMWSDLLKRLRKAGFTTYIEERFAKQYKCLIPSHRWGKGLGLEFKTEISPTSWEIKFYQNINIENAFGGEFGFHQYDRMPPVQKNLFERVIAYLVGVLVEEYHLTFYDQSRLRFPPLTAEQQILRNMQEGHWAEDPRSKLNSLSEIDALMSDYDKTNNSRSGIKDILKCGEYRVIKKSDGSLRTAQIYHHCNNMWWVIFSPSEYSAAASFEILEKVAPDFKPTFPRFTLTDARRIYDHEQQRELTQDDICTLLNGPKGL